jgi:hypothetical protein
MEDFRLEGPSLRGGKGGLRQSSVDNVASPRERRIPDVQPVLRSHRHHDIVALGFGRIRACAIGSHASRSSRALSIQLGSLQQMRKFPAECRL